MTQCSSELETIKQIIELVELDANLKQQFKNDLSEFDELLEINSNNPLKREVPSQFASTPPPNVSPQDTTKESSNTQQTKAPPVTSSYSFFSKPAQSRSPSNSPAPKEESPSPIELQRKFKMELKESRVSESVVDAEVQIKEFMELTASAISELEEMMLIEEFSVENIQNYEFLCSKNEEFQQATDLQDHSQLTSEIMSAVERLAAEHESLGKLKDQFKEIAKIPSITEEHRGQQSFRR